MRSLVISLCALLVGALFSSFVAAQAAPGYVAGDQCYGTANDAALAFCGQISGVNANGLVTCNNASVVVAGPDSAVAQITTYGYADTSSSTGVSRSTLVLLPSCDPLSYHSSFPWNLSLGDGEAIAGAICGVWLSVWVWRAAVRTLGSDGEALE